VTVATYDLQNLDGQNTDRGSLPATMTGLPAGGYQLTISFHNQQMRKSVQVDAGTTNEAPQEFVFGAARIESTPSGLMFGRTKVIISGQTPLELAEIPPQKGTVQPLIIRL